MPIIAPERRTKYKYNHNSITLSTMRFNNEKIWYTYAMQSKKLELVIFSVLFIGLSILTFFVFQPFLYIIIIAAVLAILFSPLYKKFVKIFPEWKSFSASMIVAIILIFLIIPVLFFWITDSRSNKLFLLSYAS